MKIYRLTPHPRGRARAWPALARDRGGAAERPRQMYTVSELARTIKAALEPAFPEVWVEGEVSEPKVYPSGHLWFDLKDDRATLKSVMWRDDARGLAFALHQGQQVVCRGHLEFYTPRGDLKFVAETIEPKGVGALQVAFDQLCARLEHEGLFDPARKRPLPAFPQHVGIVTSPTGAAIEDLLKILRGHVRVLLYPTRVQGEGAAAQIARGIEVLSARPDLDVLIVGRGGGSLEDLWAFNEEIVARAIAASRLPVISAVGHEKDTSVSDLVADVRAPTPTNGAELLVAQRQQVLRRLAGLLEDPALTEPETWLAAWRGRTEEAQGMLREGIRAAAVTLADRVRLAHAQVWRASPQQLVERHAQRLGHLHARLTAGMRRAVERRLEQFVGAVGRLQALSPLAVLGRGYSITFDAQDRIVRRAAQVALGAVIRTRVHEGELLSRVERATREESDGQT